MMFSRKMTLVMGKVEPPLSAAYFPLDSALQGIALQHHAMQRLIVTGWPFCNISQGFDMTIVSFGAGNPLVDGRQSEKAMLVRRGVQRLLHEMRHAVLPELPLANGRRADLISLSMKGEIWIIEIKSSIEDFRVDRKWPEYRLFCDRLFFATHNEVPLDIFPPDCGLIVSDGYSAHMLREAPEHKLVPARRKAITLDFSRTAARRLMLAEWQTGQTFGE